MLKSVWFERILVVLLWVVNLFGRFGGMEGTAVTAEFFQNTPAFVSAEWFVWLLINILLVSFTWIVIRMAMVQKGQQDLYKIFIRPFYIQALFFTIVWIIAWLNGSDLVYFLVSVFMTNTILNMVRLISGKAQLRSQNWLKMPIGLAMGIAQALLIMSLAIFTNVRISATIEIWFTIALVIILIASVTFIYVKYGNELVMLPAIVYLAGLLVRWLNVDNILAIIAGVGLIITVGLYIRVFYFQRKQLKEEQ